MNVIILYKIKIIQLLKAFSQKYYSSGVYFSWFLYFFLFVCEIQPKFISQNVSSRPFRSFKKKTVSFAFLPHRLAVFVSAESFDQGVTFFLYIYIYEKSLSWYDLWTRLHRNLYPPFSQLYTSTHTHTVTHTTETPRFSFTSVTPTISSFMMIVTELIDHFGGSINNDWNSIYTNPKAKLVKYFRIIQTSIKWIFD